MKRTILSLFMLMLGGWQLGHGLYMAGKAELAQYLLVQAWHKTKQASAAGSDSLPIRPWPWADTHPVARLHWPAQQQSLIVLSGDSGRNLAFGPAHSPATVLPGDVGVSLLGGHRDTHFAFLKNARLGDQFTIERADQVPTAFTVTEIMVVNTEQQKLGVDAQHPSIALVTCYPFDDWQAGGPLRYVVIAQADH